MLDERTAQMMQSLQNEPPLPQQRQSENQASKGDYYYNVMGHGRNTINVNSQNQENIKQYDEHRGDIVLRDYTVQGYKYRLKEMSDGQLKAEFTKEGFHIVKLTMNRDPVNGEVNGRVWFRVRLLREQERDFEYFLNSKLNFTVKSKK